MSSVALASRPDHVSPDKVIDFDFYRDLSVAEPHDVIADLVSRQPVFWTPRNGGHWVLAGHPELFDAVRNTEVFSSQTGGLPPSDFEFKQVPINSDPPEHAIYREPLARAFSPKAMIALQDSVRALAIELIEKIRNQGHSDFRLDVAEPLPVLIFMKILGLPLENLPQYRMWVEQILASGDEAVRSKATQDVIAAMSDIVRDRMAQRRDDLISTLIDIKIEGRPVTFEEMQGFCLLLFIAGLDTVMNGMCYGIRYLATHPDLQAALRAHPERITDAMEELLRRYTFTMPPRSVARDYDAYGVHFRKGDRVLLMLPGGDLDAREFEHPEAFDLDRENKVHMAFNSGPHRCVGSHLARIEIRILYEEVLKRLPEFRLDPANPPRIHGGHVIGFDSLPILWDVD